MTDKPTTAECIAAQSTAVMRDQPEVFNAVRDQLLAAQKVAKALEQFIDDDPESDAPESYAYKALTAWREAGGK